MGGRALWGFVLASVLVFTPARGQEPAPNPPPPSLAAAARAAVGSFQPVPAQEVAAALSFLAFYDTPIFQVQEDQLQKLLGDGLVFRQSRYQDRAMAIVPGERIKRAQRVLRFFGKGSHATAFRVYTKS
jgi:hypothetical protein